MTSASPFGEGVPTPLRVSRLNRDFYERVAADFDATRREPWPFAVEFVRTLELQGLPLLDLGCGNGRHATMAGTLGVPVVGLDLSRGLLRLARRHGRDAMATPAFVEGDGFLLPFRDGAFGGAMMLATIHHVPTSALRVRLLREAGRVLARGAPLLVSAWKYPHPDRHPETGLARAVARGVVGRDETLYEEGDEMVPWGPSPQAPTRFVHFMGARDLEKTLLESGFGVDSVAAVQVASKKGSDNVVAVARKPI